MSVSRPFPRLPGTGGVAVHSGPATHPKQPNYQNTTTNQIPMPLGPNERIPLDRPLSATGRVTRGLAAYRVIRNIGRGKFGVCQLVEDLDTHKQYVLKCISLSDQTDRERLLALQEVETLKRLQQPKPHPFIVKYHESFLYQDCLYIVMQWCPGGDLHHFLRDRKQTGVFLEETVIIDWLIQLLLAIRKCHDLKIIHRDIKSQNIFLIPSKFSAQQQARDAETAAAAQQAATKAGYPLGTSEQANQTTLPPVSYSIKLGDFGISKILNSTGELAMSVVGTPYSMSPEVCENRPYSYASDIWAIGCVLYELCVLKHAFDSNNLLGLVWKIVQEAYPPIPELYSQDLRELVSAMLAKDPAARPTVEQILDLKFIKKRLKVQIQEKLRERKARRSSSRGLSGSPTPYSQQEESTQNIFDNGMSVSYEVSQTGGISRYRPPEFYENERDEADHDSTAGETGGSRYGQDDADDMGPEYSRSSSVAHFSKSTVMPSRPILGAVAGLASTHSPKTLSPSNAQQAAQARAAAAAAHSGSARRPSEDSSTSSGSSKHASSSSGQNSFRTQPGSFLNHTAGGSSGMGSGSSKRLASMDTEESSPNSPTHGFGGDGTASVVLGRSGSLGRKQAGTPRSGDEARRNSEMVAAQRAPILVVSPAHGRGRASSHQQGSSSSAAAVSPASFAQRSKEQAKAQARATTRIVQKDSFPSDEREESQGENQSDDEDRRPGELRRGYEDDDGSSHAADLTEALRQSHLRGGDGSDGLGASDSEEENRGDGDEESDEDLVIEQLQSQMHEAGDPDAEGDSPIFFLPSSSDEEGEGDEEEEQEEGEEEQAEDAQGQATAPHRSSAASQKSNLQVHVTRPLPAILPSTNQRNTLQPLPVAAKQKAANLLAAASSVPVPVSPRAPPPQPSLREKFHAVKDRCLRAMGSESAFDLIYSYFQQSHLLSPRSSLASPHPGQSAFQYNSHVRAQSPTAETKSTRAVRELLKHHGHAKSAEVSADLIFSIEQLVYLAQVLDAPAKKK